MGKSILGLLDISSVKLGTADVKLYLGTEKIYPTGGYADEYLTMTAIDNCSIAFDKYIVAPYYSLDSGETWQLYDSSFEVDINAGESILWKGELIAEYPNGIGQFMARGRFNVSGNILSLVNGDNLNATPQYYNFFNLFSGTKVVNAENLILPVLDLSTYSLHDLGSYCQMFHNCEYLVTVPELPATTLGDGCYANMYSNCKSLVSVPSDYLPATSLANGCYQNMFSGCINLTSAPDLLAKTLRSEDDYCYNDMFQGCSNLAYVKCLAESIGTRDCVAGIVSDRTENGIFVKSPLCDYWEDYDIIPEGWILVDDE